jgi:hypothetical protein
VQQLGRVVAAIGVPCVEEPMEEAMENTVSGRVENIVSSAGRGKAEGKIFYSVIVAGETYSCGPRPPAGVKVGDTVSFRCEIRDGKWKSAFDLRLLEDPGPSISSPPAASSPAQTSRAPAPVAPSIGGADLRILAAAVIVSTFARTVEPGWTLEDYAAKVRDVAGKLGS